MKLREIYETAVSAGIEADVRGRSGIDAQLATLREEYDKLEPTEKEFFDTERLSNPFADTRILTGDPESDIRGLIVGIDMEVGEILLADRLRERGSGIDLVLAHHPEGSALAALADVMKMQSDIWAARGVPINVGDALIGVRMKEIDRRLSPVNHSRAVDAARHLGFSMACIHTPTDNLVNRFVQESLDRTQPKTLAEILRHLRVIPEYAHAAKQNSGPFILVGDAKARVGRIHVDFTGGTEGPKDAVTELARAGVGTIVGMHMDDKIKEAAEAAHINVVIAGHISSDNLGVNLLLDLIEPHGVEVVTTSGMHRVSRVS